MTKREKLRRKLRNNPASATIQDVETLLSGFDFSLARVTGSHHIYEFEKGGLWKQVVVPLHGRKVKPVYVKKAIEVIDDLFPEEELDNEEDNEQDS